MKIYLFYTKKSSSSFLKAFCEKHNHRIFKSVEDKEKSFGKGAERFSNISNWAINKFHILGKNLKVFIEGYSYGSKGQALFQIAENCGILKYKLLHRNISYDIIVPSVVKKGATGKGNADKDMMYEAFNKETKIDLKKLFDTEKVGNPISDIADSYFIQKVGYENSNSN